MKSKERSADRDAMKKELARKKEELERERREAHAQRNAEHRGKQIVEPSKSAAVYRPSPELAAIIGPRIVSHREASKKLWAYVKYNGLQKKDDKAAIRTDERFAALCKVPLGDEIEAGDLYRAIPDYLTHDALAEARRRFDREADEERAREQRKKRNEDQRDRLDKRERARAEAEAKRRRAFEEHQRRVDDEYKRLKGG